MLTPKLIVMVEQELQSARNKHPEGYPTDLVRGAALLCEESGEALKAALDATRHTAPSLAQLKDIHTEVLQTIVNGIQYLTKIEERVKNAKS